MLRSIRFAAALLVVAVAPAFAQDAKPTTQPATRGPLKVEIGLAGVFEAENASEVVLRPREHTALVVDKVVPQGTKVDKGAPVLWLETDKLDEEIRSTELALGLGRLSLDAAKSELETLTATVPLDLRDAEQAKQLADKTLEHWVQYDEGRRRRDTDEALKSSQYSLEYAQEELKQLEKMYQADDLTEETEEIILKRARRTAEQAQYYLERAQVQHDRTLAEVIPRESEHVREAATRAALDLAKARATLPRSLEQKRIDLAKLEFGQQKLQEKYDRLRADRQEMVVTAPQAGYVYYGQADRGRWTTGATLAKQLRKSGTLMANQIILTVVSPSPAFVRIDVPEKELGRLTAGVPATIAPTGFASERIAGRLASIEPIPFKDEAFDARVACEVGGRIMPGMTCAVKLLAYSKDDALTVPSSAVASDPTDETKKFVQVFKDGQAQRRDVKVGQAVGERTEILEGLQPGEEVVVPPPAKPAAGA